MVMGVRERFVGSIEYLRKLGFFEDYSNLTSEEIFEKIRRGEMGREWFGYEEIDEKKWREYIDKKLKQKEIRSEEALVDYVIVGYDAKRVFDEDVEVDPRQGIGIDQLNKLSGISRGVFKPTDIREEWGEWKGEDSWRHPLEGKCCKVYFNWRGEKYFVMLKFHRDFLLLHLTVDRINEIMRDTGYQYYYFPGFTMEAPMVVLTEDEAKKLRERGWVLRLYGKKENT